MGTSLLKHRKDINGQQAILKNSIELTGEMDLDVLIERIGESKYVLLGEASHGTHEYYTWRSRISRKLIEDHGFSFITVEGDWPDCYRINRYVKGYSDAGKDAFSVLQKFNRWPTWMWANWEIHALVEWLRAHNKNRAINEKAGFFGLDVYSLWESFSAIIEYLRKEDPSTMQVAMKALKCFEPFSDDEGSSYARATFMVPPICEDDVVNLLTQIRRKMTSYDMDPEGAMNAEQNAHILVEAEKYYRTMIHAGPDSWNIRDRHMVATLNRLMQFHGPKAKAIVWEHNTHIGDARATDMADEGMTNVGQLVNEEHHKQGVFSVGFGSYLGTVIAGSGWGANMQIMNVPPAPPGTWENLLHQLAARDRIIFMEKEVKGTFSENPIGHRAIGVVYHPQFENPGNYVPSQMASRYNAFVFIDKTSALHPIYTTTLRHQLPETYPFGI
jgi:erythromycin esterase